MLIILHGDDTVASRNKLNELLAQARDRDIIRLDGSRMTLEDVVTACETTSLIAENKCIVIERLFSAPLKRRQEILTYLFSPGIEYSVILWEGKTLEKTQVAKFPKETRILPFTVPQSVFKFVEGVGRVSPGESLRMLHELVKTQDATFLYAMLLRQLRMRILAKDMGAAAFSGSVWMAKKYEGEARAFSLPALIAMYRGLVAIDYKVKTGATPLPLLSQIDIWLLSL